MTLKNPVLLVLAVAALPVFWRLAVRPRVATISVGDVTELGRLRAPWRLGLARPLLAGLRVLAILGVVAALARPQVGYRPVRAWTEGVDIVLALDVSGSMIAEDLAPGRSRLDVVKEVVEEFVKKRSDDRIGMVVFAKHSYTQCPLTLDYDVLTSFLSDVGIGMIDRTRTAIGDALGGALNMVQSSPTKSRVVILLTDGTNNYGTLSPSKAAVVAEQLGVKVYTIGAGGRGIAGEIDEKPLKDIAERTGGLYFRATDDESLHEICRTIDALEKTRIKVRRFYEYDEKFAPLVILALVALVCEIVLANTLFRKIP